MAVTNKMYGPAVTNMFKGDIDLVADTIKVALLTGHVWAEDDETWADVKVDEVSGTAYVEGGETLAHTGDKVTYAAGVTTFGANADDTEWLASTINADQAVVYVFVDDGEGAPSDTSILLCCIDFDGTESSVDGTFKIEWHENGIFRATVNP